MNQYEKDKQPKVMLAFHERENMKVNKPMKRWSASLVIRKIQRNPNAIPFYILETRKFIQSDNTKC